MVKTQIFIVCDKCEKPFKDTDIVYGYAKYDNHSLTVSEKNYTDYYFDEECLNTIKETIRHQVEKSLAAGVVNGANDVAVYIPYIGESYKFYKLDFDEVNATYFYIEVDGYKQLVKVRYSDNEYLYSCINNAVDLMFRNIKQGRLMDLRRGFKEEGDRRKLDLQNAHSAACSAFDTSSIKGIKTIEAYI